MAGKVGDMLTAIDWRVKVARTFGGSWKLPLSFMALSCLRRQVFAPFWSAVPGSALHRHLQERPETPGVLLWPYQCAAWDAAERVARIASHFAVIDRLGPPLRFGAEQKLLLLDLGAWSEGVRVILDQPQWLSREGHLALNIFAGDHRAYSLAFSFFPDADGIGIFVGGIQGRSSAGALERYKAMTKDFHGMRPRDLLVELLRMLALAVDVRRIHAVAERHRFFRHPYYGGAAGADMPVDYDEIWADRGGERVAETHFALPTALSIRTLAEVPSHKRAMYRRRNEMLLELAGRLQRELRSAPLVQFEAT